MHPTMLTNSACGVPGAGLLVLCFRECKVRGPRHAWFSAMWVCRRTPLCWRASLAASTIRPCVTVKGEQGARPMRSMEYLCARSARQPGRRTPPASWCEKRGQGPLEAQLAQLAPSRADGRAAGVPSLVGINIICQKQCAHCSM